MSASERLPTSRQEFVDTLAELRRQGMLETADEAALIRQYDGMLEELRSEKVLLEAEYRDRVRDDGQDAADAWLSDAAAALGRRQGEQLGRLTRSIPAFAGQPG